MALTSLTSLNSLTSPFAKVDAGILHNVFFECLLEIEMIVPKINLIIWAFVARRIGSVCPRLVQSMPVACSLSDHLTGKTDHLMVSYRTAYVILFLIQLVNLSSYS